MVIPIRAANCETNCFSAIFRQFLPDPLCIGSQSVQVSEAITSNVPEQGILVDWIGMESNVHGRHLGGDFGSIVGTGERFAQPVFSIIIGVGEQLV